MTQAKQTEKRAKREEAGLTSEKVGAEFLAKQREEGKSKAALDKTGYHFKLANRDFGRRTGTEITAPMILKALRKVKAKSNYEKAHRLAQYKAQLAARQSDTQGADLFDTTLLSHFLKKTTTVRMIRICQ